MDEVLEVVKDLDVDEVVVMGLWTWMWMKCFTFLEVLAWILLHLTLILMVSQRKQYSNIA